MANMGDGADSDKCRAWGAPEMIYIKWIGI